MTKDYKQVLADLKSGLTKINNVLKDRRVKHLHEKALANKDIQEARIEFFKMGYNFHKREINAQEKLYV